MLHPPDEDDAGRWVTFIRHAPIAHPQAKATQWFLETDNVSIFGLSQTLYGLYDALSHLTVKVLGVFDSPACPLNTPGHSSPNRMRFASSCE